MTSNPPRRRTSTARQTLPSAWVGMPFVERTESLTFMLVRVWWAGLSSCFQNHDPLESVVRIRQVGAMTQSEAARHALYAALEATLGEDHADTLMTYLPPEDSSQLATKADLRFEVARIGERLDRLDHRFDRLEDRMDAMQRTFVTALVGGMTGLTAIFSLIVLVWA